MVECVPVDGFGQALLYFVLGEIGFVDLVHLDRDNRFKK
jgi:hypothetical protein